MLCLIRGPVFYGAIPIIIINNASLVVPIECALIRLVVTVTKALLTFLHGRFPVWAVT